MAQTELYKNLPETPGVYLMRNAKGRLLYVGKAGNLRRRVSSYFLRPHDIRIEHLVSEIASIDFEKTETAIEALILEAKLIKKHQPPYNVKEKDDKSFWWVEITKDKFPRIMMVRGKDVWRSKGVLYGPFTSASSLREALRIIRRIFPWSMHRPDETFSRPCFDYEIGLCPGTCINAITRLDYLKNIRNVKLLFEGKKKQILRLLHKEMKQASKTLDFERAQKLRGQIFGLTHIQDVALISENGIENKTTRMAFRVEGYDISNISGTSAVGSMVVFTDGKPDKNEYRKFKIRTIIGSNDVGMLKEVLTRRFSHYGGPNLAKRDGHPKRTSPSTEGALGWPLPHLILIDGGVPQANAAREVLSGLGLRIPVVGIAKGAERKRNDFIGTLPPDVDRKMLIRVRDEAHRFAIKYHKELRGRDFLTK